MTCRFETQGDQLVCKNCGLKVKASLFPKGKPFVLCPTPYRESPVPAQPTPEGAEEQGGAAGLGDMAAAALGAVGITKERAQAVAEKLGVKDCGCNRRQKWMNEMGNKYLGLGAGRTKNPIDPS
jgi:hypothetical protein